MNKRGHVLNGLLLGIGVGILLVPSLTRETLISVVAVGVPVTLGALVPDIDTTFGTHRKTLHNLPLLVGFAAFPHFFGNLQYVWIGVATHYALDVVGTRRGIALFYPLSTREFSLPLGVPVSSDYTDVVTVTVTALELVVVTALVYEVPQIALERSVEMAELWIEARGY